LLWAVELDASGWGEYCWSRLIVIVSEDVGLAEPLMPSVIRALYENWNSIRKRRKGPPRSSAT